MGDMTSFTRAFGTTPAGQCPRRQSVGGQGTGGQKDVGVIFRVLKDPRYDKTFLTIPIP